MNKTYLDLITQTHDFPQEGFDLENSRLTFHDVDLHGLIQKHGTPLKLTYLPKIRHQIRKARRLFKAAFRQHEYRGSYEFCYCTKCCHFNHVISAALDEQVSIETSSSFDIDLIHNLYDQGLLDTEIKIVHNGYKTDAYLKGIESLLERGFENCIIVLDNRNELAKLPVSAHSKPVKIGIRVSIEEEPRTPYYTSRLGIDRKKVLEFADTELTGNLDVELTMLHFFVDSGIMDNSYYWGELQKVLHLYNGLKERFSSLQSLNIGGGFPIRNNLGFNYDYRSMTNKIIQSIKEFCDQRELEHPDIYTEFGKYTVGESGAVIFQVLEQKKQNDNELWYILDNSLINTIPDFWTIDEEFILLPLNKWDQPYRKVSIGGISCDHSDYYNSNQINRPIFLPACSDSDKEPLYAGFFHTGAYQDAISGYGGIKHCLIPSPKHIVVDFNGEGQLTDHIYRSEQTVDNMLTILGYHD